MKKSPGSAWKPSAWASGMEGSTAPTATTPITSAPALQTEFLDTIAAIERPLAEAIAARTDSNRDTGLGPEVLAAAVSAAARVAAQRWLQPEPDTRFSVMLHDALTLDRPALRAADH
jgi:MftR C-terminal domain